ncbi:MAG: Fic family protein [Nanoarchaeota archaeon]|nr:Fic family protein [Nanoarchaeota archaeon]
MVSLKKKTMGNKEYYYLEHSFRKGKSIKKKELYLGSEMPENIEKIKKEFINSIYKEKWHKTLEDIKRGFSKEIRSMPKSDKAKATESFLIKFTYNTQRIEGSKLTLRETANLLEEGISPKEKPVRDIKEAEAHKKVFYNVLDYKKELSLSIVLNWHRKLFWETKPDTAGKIRAHGVAISGSKFTPPSPVELNPLLNDFFKWYSKNKDKIHPVELAALVHLKFVTIHPFGDGNGRISRLMMNFVLNKRKYPLLDIPYENRNSYYNALERSQVKKDENIFGQWFVKKYIKENKRFLKP